MLDLERYVCHALDPQGSETLRCASIRHIGQWLRAHAADMNVEAFMFDLFRLLNRLNWSVNLLHAFAMAQLSAAGISIKRRESSTRSERRKRPMGSLR